MSGADIILRVLAEQGVDTLFGYSGGAILPTYDAVFRFNESHAANPERQIKFVVPANEQAAGFMAAGYARASESRCVHGDVRAWRDQCSHADRRL